MLTNLGLHLIKSVLSDFAFELIDSIFADHILSFGNIIALIVIARIIVVIIAVTYKYTRRLSRKQRKIELLYLSFIKRNKISLGVQYCIFTFLEAAIHSGP